MNPLLFLSRLTQSSFSPLNNCACKAIATSSAITDSDSPYAKSTSSWASDYFNSYAASMANWLFIPTSSWFISPMIARMQDSTLFSITPLGVRSSTENSVHHTRCDAMDRRSSADVTNKTSIPYSTPRSAPDLVDEPIQHGVPPSLPWLYGSPDEVPSTLPQSTTVSPTPSLKRVDSKEWVNDYKHKKERIDKINFHKIFGGRGDPANNEIPTLPPFHRTESVDSQNSFSQSSDWTVSSFGSPIYDPSPDDVICGRGGRANSHPGNISFRAEALKLRGWYESSSKSEKFTISSILVDFVRERGGRFVRRDDGEGWVEVEGGEVRKKASQALREGKLRELER